MIETTLSNLDLSEFPRKTSEALQQLMVVARENFAPERSNATYRNICILLAAAVFSLGYFDAVTDPAHHLETFPVCPNGKGFYFEYQGCAVY